MKNLQAKAQGLPHALELFKQGRWGCRGRAEEIKGFWSQLMAKWAPELLASPEQSGIELLLHKT